MVVDDVEQDGEAAAVGLAHEPLEGVRPAIRALDGEEVRRVVPPGHVAGELGQRHQRDGVDPEVDEVVELPERAVQVARAVLLRSEGAYVQLVEHQRVPRRPLEGVALPVERGGIVDERIPYRVGEAPRVRVVAVERLAPGGEDELVRIPRRHAADERAPRPAVLGGHRMSRPRPAVEASGDEDGLGVRRPHAERGPAVV